MFWGKPVGRLSADKRPTVGQQSADKRPTVGRQTADSQPTDGRQSANRRPTIGRQVFWGALLHNYPLWYAIGQKSYWESG